MSLPSDIVKIKKIPTVFVIFGATGDLSRKRIFPALLKLHEGNLLPQRLKIIGCARTKFTTRQFRKILIDLPDFKNFSSKKNVKSLQDFLNLVEYLPLDVAQNISVDQLSLKIAQFEKEIANCAQRIFYMAISPQILKQAADNIGTNKLHLGCQIHNFRKESRPKVIVEKPFGEDLESAQKIAQTLSHYFEENNIYRIDHYLGKETVQNIFAFRFGNDLFEPVWNNQCIDHVQITTAEGIGVEKRGEFYDKTGALRDFTQNHLLQLLALVAMDEPEKFEAGFIRKKKLEILTSIKNLTSNEILKSTVRGQYESYRLEEKIKPVSKTETYALVKLFVDSPRWHQVPFYLRTGKKLMGQVSSIIIEFKEKGHKLFQAFWQKPMPNHITIQIQPNEGIGIRLVAKKPGLTTALEPVDMEFCYKTSFDVPQPEAYERLLLDVILGDQTLFISQKEVEASWKVIDPIRKVWDKDKPKLAVYKPGSWGPKEADDLIKKDGRVWLAPLLTICKI